MCLLKDLFYFLGSHGPFILFAYFIYVCLKKKKIGEGQKTESCPLRAAYSQ